MAQILVVSLTKGGVGKTTTTLNLAANLAQRGRRVLVVDTDTQGNLTKSLGVPLESVEYSTHEVLLNAKRGAGFAVSPTPFGLSIIPSGGGNLQEVESELSGQIGRELLLRMALEPLKDDFDYIFIDTPPSPGTLTINALVAATSVLVPLEAQYMAYDELSTLEGLIRKVRILNADLSIGGIIITKYDGRTNICQVIEQRARQEYGDTVFKTVIPVNTKLAEAPALKKPVSRYAPESTGALAYQHLTEEVIARYEIQ